MAKIIIGRPRPEQALDLLTSTGFSYPSSHMTAAVASAIAVAATFAVTRQSLRARALWQIGAGLLVIAVGVDRWLTGAHYVSDIIGGALYGALVASAALIIAGVRVPVPTELVTELVRSMTPAVESGDPLRRAAVIFNPAKVTDWITFRRHVEYELKSRGWDRALWLETTSDDPGRAMTEQAVSEGVDLVLGAGGDGTIRVICAGLAGSGVPFGLIPGRNRQPVGPQHRHSAGRGSGLGRGLRRGGQGDRPGQDHRRRRDTRTLRGDGRHRDRRGDHGRHRPEPEEGGRLGGVLRRCGAARQSPGAAHHHPGR